MRSLPLGILKDYHDQLKTHLLQHQWSRHNKINVGKRSRAHTSCNQLAKVAPYCFSPGCAPNGKHFLPLAQTFIWYYRTANLTKLLFILCCTRCASIFFSLFNFIALAVLSACLPLPDNCLAQGFRAAAAATVPNTARVSKSLSRAKVFHRGALNFLGRLVRLPACQSPLTRNSLRVPPYFLIMKLQRKTPKLMALCWEMYLQPSWQCCKLSCLLGRETVMRPMIGRQTAYVCSLNKLIDIKTI